MSLSILLQLAALVCLCLSMDKHFRTIYRVFPTSNKRRTLKRCGWLLMTSSLFALVNLSDLPQIAIIWWLAFLSLNILLTAVIFSLLSERQRHTG